ncbi:DgyrCDS3185 [Dimorphilus gyrociliatus]|uniref:DgyrCDS3185 n=1 Tax=Dimorphilus gyrociliatus TaxID=2664684 RepID=A0A7I8VF70_9ANNE|nr:DgyrCDS3185 [Dimorphilus gyrociliatus]
MELFIKLGIFVIIGIFQYAKSDDEYFGFTKVPKTEITKHIAVYRVSNLNACMVYAQRSYMSKAITFDEKTQRCYLHDSLDKSLQQPNNDISLFIRHENIIAKNYFAVDQLCSAGDDIKTINNTLLDRCVNTCNTLSNCVSFSFNTVRKMCWLKDKIKSYEEFTSRPHNVFYIKDKKAFFDHKDFEKRNFEANRGEELKRITVENDDFQQCFDECKKSVTCAAFTITNDICYLQKSVKDPIDNVGSIFFVKMNNEVN